MKSSIIWTIKSLMGSVYQHFFTCRSYLRCVTRQTPSPCYTEKTKDQTWVFCGPSASMTDVSHQRTVPARLLLRDPWAFLLTSEICCTYMSMFWMQESMLGELVQRQVRMVLSSLPVLCYSTFFPCTSPFISPRASGYRKSCSQQAYGV